MSESELAKRWVDTWAKAAPELQKVRDADIRAEDTAKSMKVFSGSAMRAVTDRPAEAWCGLIEQLRWFAKVRRAASTNSPRWQAASRITPSSLTVA